ncbi:hypothetical protein QBC35DRAFT_528225 [Podospora australis]|uniref:Uncharacterized protein n=1 Tax=Podospora australis TaxID=1536484 RepID=A0AAN6X380_9PEZI|nr:hypothetical protein QBC35DRAFT_528225 [Podospora australis]
MEESTTEHSPRAKTLRRLASELHQQVTAKSKTLFQPKTPSEQPEVQQAIDTVNFYHHHLGELVSLRGQHEETLSTRHPESMRRADMRCSVVGVDDGESRMWRRLRWKLLDKRELSRRQFETERNDTAVTSEIFSIQHLVLDRAFSQLRTELQAEHEAEAAAPQKPQQPEYLLLMRPICGEPGQKPSSIEFSRNHSTAEAASHPLEMITFTPVSEGGPENANPAFSYFTMSRHPLLAQPSLPPSSYAKSTTVTPTINGDIPLPTPSRTPRGGGIKSKKRHGTLLSASLSFETILLRRGNTDNDERDLCNNNRKHGNKLASSLSEPDIHGVFKNHQTVVTGSINGA